jgi:hypothetical protein
LVVSRGIGKTCVFKDKGQMNDKPRRTLEEPEGGDRWTESPNDTFLISRCVAQRRKPHGEFTTEDVRIMIGQNIGLRHLIPLALERLTRNMFVAGDFYRGDLSGVVLRADRAFWLQSPSDLERAHDLAAEALDKLPRLKTTDTGRCEPPQPT